MLSRPDIILPWIYLVAAIPFAWLGLYAWRSRPAIAVASFAQAMLGMSVWAVAYSLELFFNSIFAKIFFTKIQYIGEAIAPLAMFFFAIEFVGKRHILNARKRILVALIPALAIALTWTNEFHRLMWDNAILIESGGLTLLQLDFNAFFWVHTIYSYGLLIIASIVLIIEFIQRPGIYRIQISFVIVSIFLPLLGNALYLSERGGIKHLDLTPLFFLPTALALSWAITKYRLLEILPLEHIAILANMRDSVIALNPQQRILYINATAERLLNVLEEKAIGQPFEKISPTYAKKLLPYISHIDIETEISIEEDKQTRVYELSVSPVNSRKMEENAAQPNKILVLHDITERKEAETTLKRRELLMSSISLAAEQFLRESTWEQNIPNVLEKIGQAADVSRVAVAINYTDENNVIHSSLCYEWASPTTTSQINNLSLKHVPLRKSGLGRWEDWLSQGLVIDGIVKNLPQSEKDFYKDRESLSIAVVPIFVDSRWWGFIEFDECRYERIWSALELEAFYLAANIFGAAETRARTEQKLINRQRLLAMLHEIVEIALSADDIKEMANIIVERLGELVNANGCFLTIWDETEKRPIPVAAYGPQKDIYASIQTTQGERTFTEMVLQAGHTLAIKDAAKDANIHQVHAQTQSILALPLIAERKKLGAVILTFNQSRKISADEISICEQAAALVALALEKFQAVEDAKQRAVKSENLRKASAAISETLDPDQAIVRILEQLKLVLPYDSASVQLLENNELRIVGGSGFKMLKEVLEMRFPIPGNNPNTIVIETGKPYILGDAPSQYSAFRELQNQHIRSWLGVPLIFQDKIIGLLAIDNSTPNKFTEEDATLALIFANQVAIALENARIFKEKQEQAIIDPLTTVYNRRGLLDLGKTEFEKALHANKKISAIMADVDRFKNINDTYGHDVGDKVLQEFALRCKKCAREMDLVGRYGGEEIVLLLPNTDLNLGIHIAERLRSLIANTPFKISDTLSLAVTASLGVACVDANILSLEALINRADQSMYLAKRAGRNQVKANV